MVCFEFSVFNWLVQMLVPVIFPPITTEPPGEHKVPPDLRNRAIRLIERQADNLFLSKSSDNEAIVAG